MPTMMHEPTKEWEITSSAVLNSIRCFVDGLQSAPCLKTWTIKEHADAKTQKIDASLFAHLQSLGVVQQVQSLAMRDQFMSMTPQHLKVSTQNNEATKPFESILLGQNKCDDRKQILYQIIFPLLKQLQRCYAAIDDIESSSPQRDEAQTVTSSPDDRRSKRKNAAPPPIGMLSLNDYVNVACLLEFAVSISLVPALEYPYLYQLQLNPYSTKNGDSNCSSSGTVSTSIRLTKIAMHTTTMAQKRIQALPKPLAGRISKIALTWGTTYAAMMHDSLCKTIMESDLLSNHNNNDAREFYDAYIAYQSYTEVISLVTSIGHLVLLDRFRPMLLPRHLSDIYLGLLIGERLRWVLLGLQKNASLTSLSKLQSSCIIQVQRATEQQTSHDLECLERALVFTSLKFHSSFITKVSSDETKTLKQRTIDHREAALACRTLLSSGAIMNSMEQSANPSIPPWLRIRLGQYLTTLAQENLRSVVDVFVTYARGYRENNDGDDHNGNCMGDEIMTGAAARLARALCARPAGAVSSERHGCTPFLEKLFHRFVEFLIEEGQENIGKSREVEKYEPVRSRSSVAMYLTLWATIGQLSLDVYLSTFVPKLTSGLFVAEDSGRSEDDALQSTAAIGALISAAPSSLDPSLKKKIYALLVSSLPSQPLGTAERIDSTLLSQMLRLATFFYRDIESRASKLVVPLDRKEKHDCCLDVAVMTIIKILQVMPRLGSEAQNQERYDAVAYALLNAVSVNTLDRDGYSYECVNYTQQGDILYPHCYLVKRSHVDRSDDLMKEMERRAKLLVQRVVLPLSGMAEDMSLVMKDARTVPSNLFRLVLQLHFSNFTQSNGTSKCAPNDGDDEGLRIASTTLLALLCEECSPALLLGGDHEAEIGVLKTQGLILDSGAALLGEGRGINSQNEHAAELLSTTSIVLSLLVAILELGTEKRSEGGELMFQSMMPSLRTLSCGEVSSAELSNLVAELAEMASHAMALIAVRNNDANDVSGPRPRAAADNKSDFELILDYVAKAEQDLESTQPPLRARGVVSLRHIARSLADSVFSHKPKKSLVEEVDRVKTFDGSNEQVAMLARTLTRLCLNALADSESYVYLASIHTLVAISDICPSEIIPLLGLAVSTGSLNVTVLMDGGKEIPVEMSLTQEQRIKSAEALIFIIRRHGDGIFLTMPSLLEMMLFGQIKMSANHHDGDTQNLSHLIQVQTHDYFQKSHENDDEVDVRMRLDTGGPVFSCEEGDLLRSAAIFLVCELVSTLHPKIVSNYCHVLVRLVLDALQLESSRPVRRSVASLARELYACVMKEETADEGGEKITSTMAIAMVCAGEDKLFNALTRCADATDVDSDKKEVKGKTRLFDPAAQSRSREALALRDELDVIFQMAAVVAHSMEREAEDPVVEAVRKALSES